MAMTMPSRNPLRTFLVAGLLGLIPQLVRAEYLFVHFKMEKDALCEQVYFGVSKDGLCWETVNQGNPVLVSTLGEQGVRDPHIIRSSDGKRFFLVATDLSIFRNRDWTRAVQKGSRALVVWESDDLIRWSAPRLVEVAAADAGCTWAPEMSWDAAKGAYLLYWASRTRDDGFGKHRIWATYTKDFRTFSAPFVYLEQASHVIDTTIVRDGITWFRFTKDERSKAITMEKSTSLVGGWQPVDTFSLKGMTGYEGPTCYQLPDGSWCLLLDHYGKARGYEAFFAKALSDGHFSPDTGLLKMPYKYRHGTVMKITKDEYQRLKAMGDSRKPPQAALPGVHADPNVVRFGDKFYIYPTTDGFNGWTGDTFSVFSSTDLKAWKDEGPIFSLPKDTTWAVKHAWAPTAATCDGKFYFYFCGDQQIGVAVGDKPTGPFKDALGKPMVPKGAFKGQMIDPAVFIDDDGSAYLYFGNGHCYGVRLNEDMISFDRKAVVELTPPGYREGSFMLKRKGVYYLMWSENDTRDPNYCVSYATGTSPLGPFTKARENPVLKGEGIIRGAGHHSVVEFAPDQWAMVYHRFRIPGGNGYNRETCISPMGFNAGGGIRPVDVFSGLKLTNNPKL